MMKQIDLAKIRANMKASKDFHVIELEKELDDEGLYILTEAFHEQEDKERLGIK